jgi:uncharacterized protein (TIGR02145 family)
MLPAGYRSSVEINSRFSNTGVGAYFWSSGQSDASYGYGRQVVNLDDASEQRTTARKDAGRSVRCVGEVNGDF